MSKIVPRVCLDRVSLDFPVYDAESRSLTHSMSKSIPVGGRIRHKNKKTTSILALDGISLELNQGDRVALLGHNGAGKTSLLKLLSGFYEPTSGSITSQGRIAALLNLMSGLDLNMSGYDNILLVGMLHGLKRAEILKKVEDISEFSELGEYLNMPVRLYSSGMILRLAFAICTSVECDILLLDEWIGAGDHAFREKTHERLSRLVFRSAILVFATHDLVIARELCHKAIFLEHGKLLYFGDIEAGIDYSQEHAEKAAIDS